MAIGLPAVVQTEVRGLARDTHSKALISTDAQALHRSRLARRKTRDNQQLRVQVDSLNTICANLESRIDSLTCMLHDTLAKLSG